MTTHNDSIGYLLVGHGTRKAEGARQLEGVFEQFSQQLPAGMAAYCFLELAEPSIPAAIEDLRRRGIKRIVVVPLLLFTADHALADIPDAVQAAAEKFGVEVLGQTSSLGCDPAILQLSAMRFRDAVCTRSVAEATRDCSTASNTGTGTGGIMTPGAANKPCSECVLTAPSGELCTGFFCSQTALVFVGRGSKSDYATSQMRRFAELRRNLCAVRWQETCFLHGQTPTLDEALDALIRRPEPIAVIQPHLVFEGLLMDQLRSKLEQCRAAAPHKSWILVDTLGTDHSLAETLATIAQNAVAAVAIESNV
ncbi:MAG TPA: hypothetical protein DDW52_05895 [Planctomycetaceae bacterium]|nr:hypothetical protein [Planctomycetaceae bacterium]